MKYLNIVVLFLVIFNSQAKIFKKHPVDQLPTEGADNTKPQQPVTTENPPTTPTAQNVQPSPTTTNTKQQQVPKTQQQQKPVQKSIPNIQGSGQIALIQKDNNFLMPIQVNDKNYTSLLSMQENMNWLFVDKGQFCLNGVCDQVTSDLQCSAYTDKKINDNTVIQSSRTGKLEYSVNLDKTKRDLQAQFWVASKFSTNLPLSSSMIMLNINDWSNFSITSKGSQIFAAVGASKPNQMIRFDQTVNQQQPTIKKQQQQQQNDQEEQQDQDNQDDQQQQDQQQNQDQDQEEEDNNQQQSPTTAQTVNNYIYMSINQAKIKQSTSNIPIKFAFYSPSSGQNMLFSLPQSYATLLKQAILKEYFNSQCKEKTANKIICKKNTEPTDKPFMICKGASNCIQLGLSNLVNKVKTTYSYAFASQTTQQIIFYPTFVKKYYDLYFDKGSFIGANKNSQYTLPEFIQNDQEDAEDTVDGQPNSQATATTDNPDDQMSWQKKGIVASIAMYGVLGFLCIAIVKSTSGSFVSSTIDAGFSLFANYFHRKRGYEPSNFNEQIDDSNSVTIGYNQDRNRQLFWQKNSVEGI